MSYVTHHPWVFGAVHRATSLTRPSRASWSDYTLESLSLFFDARSTFDFVQSTFIPFSSLYYHMIPTFVFFFACIHIAHIVYPYHSIYYHCMASVGWVRILVEGREGIPRGALGPEALRGAFHIFSVCLRHRITMRGRSFEHSFKSVSLFSSSRQPWPHAAAFPLIVKFYLNTPINVSAECLG
ncbi:hypothetical protein EJ08DRAFT_293842 [Tothia fuscella]|uniref:Uncharacterized protein n=1 Tax=Tothia fuscella TaxID=1048955 RepID=A0A9P4P0E6_9PEZI|nr:hypothetical protein EJ08DRAFT_293842 [Tothia fuscella]